MLLQCSTEKLLQALTKPQNTLAWIECYTATRTEARVARSQSSSRSGGVDSSFLCFALPAKAPHSSALAEARPTTLLAHVPSPIVCTDARPTTILAPLLPTRASPSPLRTGICPRNVHALANVYALAPAAPSSMCLPSLCCTIASQSKVDSTDIAHAAHCRCDLSAAVCEGMKLLSFFKVEVDPCCLPIAAARVAQQPPGRPNVERDAGLHLKPAWVDEALRVPPLAGRVQSPPLGHGESETKKFVRSGQEGSEVSTSTVHRSIRTHSPRVQAEAREGVGLAADDTQDGSDCTLAPRQTYPGLSAAPLAGKETRSAFRVPSILVDIHNRSKRWRDHGTLKGRGRPSPPARLRVSGSARFGKLGS